MANESSYDYLYVAEWDDSVHRPPYTVMHEISLNPGANREDFEKFMVEEGFSQVSQVKTKAGEVAAQYLLTVWCIQKMGRRSFDTSDLFPGDQPGGVARCNCPLFRHRTPFPG